MASQSGKDTSYPIQFGPFYTGWGASAPGEGYVYYWRASGEEIRPTDLRIALTGETDIEQIDATDKKWVYKASCIDGEGPANPPISFRQLRDVLAGENATLVCKQRDYTPPYAWTRRKLESPVEEKLLGLMREYVEKSLKHWGVPDSEARKTDSFPYAADMYAKSRFEIVSSRGRCEVIVFDEGAISPELMRSWVLAYRIPCPGIADIVEKATAQAAK